MAGRQPTYPDHIRADALYLVGQRRLIQKTIAECLGVPLSTLKSFMESQRRGAFNPETVLTAERKRELDELTQRILDKRTPAPTEGGKASAYPDYVRAASLYLDGQDRLLKHQIQAVMGLPHTATLPGFRRSVERGSFNPERVLSASDRRELDELTQRIVDGAEPSPKLLASIRSASPAAVEKATVEPQPEPHPNGAGTLDVVSALPSLMVEDGEPADDDHRGLTWLARAVDAFAQATTEGNEQLVAAVHDAAKAQATVTQLRTDHQRELDDKDAEIAALNTRIRHLERDRLIFKSAAGIAIVEGM